MFNHIDSKESRRINPALGKWTSPMDANTEMPQPKTPLKDQLVKSETTLQEKQYPSFGRVELPKSSPQNKDYLADLIAALQEVYGTMSKSAQYQINRFSQSQEISQDISSAIFSQTQDEVVKQKKDIELQQQLADAQDSGKAVSTVFKVVQGVLFAVTILSMFVDFGASETLIPLETEMMNMGGDALAGGAERMAAESLVSENLESEGALNNNLLKADGEGATPEGVPNPIAQMSKLMQQERTAGEVGQLEKIEQEGAEASGKTTQENAKSISDSAKKASSLNKVRAKKVASYLLNKLSMAGNTAVFAFPQLFEGIKSMKIADVLNKLADAQKDLGETASTIQKNNLIFRYCQQAAQRNGDTAREVVKEMGDVFQVAGDAMKSYRQITFNLAQAV